MAAFDNKKYKLKNVIVHAGNYGSGHYYAFNKITANGSTFWIKCDDTSVKIVNEKEVFEANYGGGDKLVNFKNDTSFFFKYFDKISTTSTKSLSSSISAYILIYALDDQEVLNEINETIEVTP